MLKYKIMFQIFFVSKYFWVLEAVIFGTLLPDHPVEMKQKSMFNFFPKLAMVQVTISF